MFELERDVYFNNSAGTVNVFEVRKEATADDRACALVLHGISPFAKQS